MNWININSAESISEILELSKIEKVMILKFSPKCAINYVVRNLLEREWHEGEMRMKTYMVDVVSNKALTEQIEKEFGVTHESPQALILEKEKPVFTASHGKVIYSELKKYAN